MKTVMWIFQFRWGTEIPEGPVRLIYEISTDAITGVSQSGGEGISGMKNNMSKRLEAGKGLCTIR